MTKKTTTKKAAAKKAPVKKAIKAKAPKAAKVAKVEEAKPEVEAKGPTKRQQIIDLLNRPEGATVKQLMDATSWQRHSVQGQLSTIRSKEKLNIVSTKESGKDAVYRIAA